MIAENIITKLIAEKVQTNVNYDLTLKLIMSKKTLSCDDLVALFFLSVPTNG